MYCPSCGQQQVSDEMRYCSRCGLALTGLMEWLVGGRPPLRVAEEVQVAPDSRRRKNIRRAGKLMFFAGALFPIFLIISIVGDEPGPLVIPFFLFFVALAWMLYARIFMSKTEPVKHPGGVQPALPPGSFQTSTFGHAPAHGSLPPAAAAPPLPNRGQVRTNELAQRPSVTEHTTRLLDNE
ncbi:MAG: hypothetical protein LC794_05170 [Acidobacteria bacterium]|nr:hypothetical protein [Acidobacteriota bacterium]